MRGFLQTFNAAGCRQEKGSNSRAAAVTVAGRPIKYRPVSRDIVAQEQSPPTDWKDGNALRAGIDARELKEHLMKHFPFRKRENLGSNARSQALPQGSALTRGSGPSRQC